MTLEELESSWSALEPPTVPNAITGRRAVGLPADRSIYVAVDSQRRRHLLIQVPDETTPVSQRETRSLEITTARFQVGSNPESLYVDLVCTDSAQHATFTAIAQDLIRSLAQTPGPLRDSILGALGRWRAFWTVKTTGMSREDALGLFGELWFLRRWLGTTSVSAVKRWQVTDSARHDYQWPLASIEVKTAATQSASAPIHHIASLEQLADPEQGQLYLFSLQVCDDALAANTLHSLVGSLITELQSDVQTLAEFNAKLAARGYSPADQQAPARAVRILAERLYRVDATFPRLIRDTFGQQGIPRGITSVSYQLDLGGCDAWLVATQPQHGDALFE
ncbi:MAG: PD-(D/E)XK motif protein [Steroidobacteraceae bacterium]